MIKPTAPPAAAVATAAALLGDVERAKKWLKTPHVALGGKTPIEALETEAGSDRVMESLYSIAYGGVA